MSSQPIGWGGRRKRSTETEDGRRGQHPPRKRQLIARQFDQGIGERVQHGGEDEQREADKVMRALCAKAADTASPCATAVN